MLFTPDSQKLILSTFASPNTLVIELSSSESNPKLLHSFSHTHIPRALVNGKDFLQQGDEDEEMKMELGDYRLHRTYTSGCVLNHAVSRDAQWLAFSDSTRRVVVCNLDTLQHHCALPSFPYEISCITFDPTAPAMLYIGFKNNTIQIFNVETKLFPEWAHGICGSLPKRFSQLHDPIQGLLFNPPSIETSKQGVSNAVYAWGSSWLCKLDLNLELPSPDRKRSRDEDKRGGNEKTDKRPLEVCTRYRNILSVAFLGPKELLVVERPITDVFQTLPPAFFRPKYGTA